MAIPTARIPGLKMGRAGLFNSDVDAQRRVFFITRTTLATGVSSVAFTQGQTRISDFDAIILTPEGDTGGTASVSLTVVNRSGGTFYAKNDGISLNRSLTINVLAIGKPDPNRIMV